MQTPHANGRHNDARDDERTVDENDLDTEQRGERAALEPVAEALRVAGFYAYIALDAENRWAVACDTDEGRIDVRVGNDGYELDVWDTSPGLFLEEEDERRRGAQERLARVSLPALARGYLLPNQEVWWDEADHGVGLRLRGTLPFNARDQIPEIARRSLAELNELIAFIEQKLWE